jgi:DNA-binding FadR family transcriptional regulator
MSESPVSIWQPDAAEVAGSVPQVDALMSTRVPDAALAELFTVVFPHLNERQRRLFAGAAAFGLGRGGDSAVARAARLSRNTVAAGRKEWEELAGGAGTRVRRQGAGRRPMAVSHPDLIARLTTLVQDGEPCSGHPLDWTFHSTYELADALTRRGLEISPGSVAGLLRTQGFQLDGTGRLAGQHRRRDVEAQLMEIAEMAGSYLASSLPVVEVAVRSQTACAASALPGRLDLRSGWAALTTETVRKWWLAIGREQFPAADRLLICSTSFGADEDESQEWELALTRLADQTGVELTALHIPPVTRRWHGMETQLTELVIIHSGQGDTTYEVTVDLLRGAAQPDPSADGLHLEGGTLPPQVRHARFYRAEPMRGEQANRPRKPDVLQLITGAPTSRHPGEAAAAEIPVIPRTNKVAEVVAHDITRDISTWRLQPGSRLAGIGSAKHRYHVSGSSARESMRMLEMLGLLSVKPGPGGGPLVRQVTTEDFGLTTIFYYRMLGVTVRDLIEARMTLEPILVRFVAQQQSPTVTQRLRWYLNGVGQEDPSRRAWLTRRSPTASFHRALVETENPILDIMVHSLQECWLVMRKEASFPREVSHHDRDHKLIAEAILRGEEVTAERLMQRHMDYVSTFADTHFSELMEKVIDW